MESNANNLHKESLLKSEQKKTSSAEKVAPLLFALPMDKSYVLAPLPVSLGDTKDTSALVPLVSSNKNLNNNQQISMPLASNAETSPSNNPANVKSRIIQLNLIQQSGKQGIHYQIFPAAYAFNAREREKENVNTYRSCSTIPSDRFEPYSRLLSMHVNSAQSSSTAGHEPQESLIKKPEHKANDNKTHYVINIPKDTSTTTKINNLLQLREEEDLQLLPGPARSLLNEQNQMEIRIMDQELAQHSDKLSTICLNPGIDNIDIAYYRNSTCQAVVSVVVLLLVFLVLHNTLAVALTLYLDAACTKPAHA